MEYCFGVDIGGTTVKMGLFTIEGKLLEKWEIKTRTEQEGEAILPDVADSLNQKMEEKKLGKEQVSGIGIGIPAPVNAEGIVQNTANLGWGYKEVRKEMEDLTQMKVAVGNDANMAALGEMWLGAGKGEKNLIMVTLGTGVGGGVIVNGQPVVGAHGAGGEIGHILSLYTHLDVYKRQDVGIVELDIFSYQGYRHFSIRMPEVVYHLRPLLKIRLGTVPVSYTHLGGVCERPPSGCHHHCRRHL